MWVPEFVRGFVEKKRGAPEYRDVEAIARGQMALEDQTASEVGSLLIQDTDLLSTVVYSRHYFRDCPEWIEIELRNRAGDLYLLADIDVPWTPDGEQRDRGDRREDLQQLFRSALVEHGFSFVEVTGSHARRLEIAITAVDELWSG